MLGFLFPFPEDFVAAIALDRFHTQQEANSYGVAKHCR